LVLTLIGGVAGIAFVLLSAAGVMTGKSTGKELAAFIGTEPRLPMLLELPADVLLGRVGMPDAQTGTITLLVALLLPCLFLACAAPIYERAFENAWVTFRPSLACTVRRMGRRWPATPAASIFRRELMQYVPQPASLFGYLFLAVLIFMIARSNPLSLSFAEGSAVPQVVSSAARIFFTGLMFSSMSVVGFAGDFPYLILYKSSPIRPAVLFRGRIAILLLPLGWTLLLVLLMGHWLIGASGGALLLSAIYLLPAMALTLGLISDLGPLTIPRRGGNGAPMPSATRMLIMSIGIALIMALVLGLCVGFWNTLCASYMEQDALARLNPVTLLLVTQGAAWIFAILVGGLGCAIGLRNYQKLLSPEE
jgi:hypothetical protein